MTPTARIFNELLDTVARAYEFDVAALTAEENWAPGPVREARGVICFVGTDTLGLSTRELGRLMQRDNKAIGRTLARARVAVKASPVLRRVVDQVTLRLREHIRHFDVFEPAEAAQ